MVETMAFGAANETASRHAEVVEDEFCAVNAAIAQFLDLAADGEAFTLFAQEHGHSLVARLSFRVRFGQHGKAVAVDTVGNPRLGAVQHIVFAVAARDGANALQVRARIGLREADATAPFATGEFRQKEVLLCLRA